MVFTKMENLLDFNQETGEIPDSETLLQEIREMITKLNHKPKPVRLTKVINWNYTLNIRTNEGNKLVKHYKYMKDMATDIGVPIHFIYKLKRGIGPLKHILDIEKTYGGRTIYDDSDSED